MTKQSILSVTPKVSVTVPTYNHGHWLAECLDSIVTQKTNFPFEIIVADDASTDPLSRDIFDEYASRYPELIVPVKHETNIGPWRNYVDLMNRARTEYIAHCDGDDMMLPGKLQKQADFLDAHPNFSVVGHKAFIQKPDGTRKKSQTDCGKLILTIDDILEQEQQFINSSTMSRKSLQTIWTLDGIVFDQLVMIDRAIKGPVGIIDEILGVYRIGVGIYAAERGTINKAYHQSLDFALARGCDPMSVLIGAVRFDPFNAPQRLLKKQIVLDALSKSDYHKISKINHLKTKMGMTGLFLLRKWPPLVQGFAFLWGIAIRLLKPIKKFLKKVIK